jgi:hypothetical protein
MKVDNERSASSFSLETIGVGLRDEFVHRLHIEYTSVDNPLISIFVGVPYQLLGIQTSMVDLQHINFLPTGQQITFHNTSTSHFWGLWDLPWLRQLFFISCQNPDKTQKL